MEKENSKLIYRNTISKGGVGRVGEVGECDTFGVIMASVLEWPGVYVGVEDFFIILHISPFFIIFFIIFLNVTMTDMTIMTIFIIQLLVEIIIPIFFNLFVYVGEVENYYISIYILFFYFFLLYFLMSL